MPRQPSSCRPRPSFGIGGGGCETKSVRPELTDMHSTKCTTVVGCTHTIVRFQTRIRRNDETENFGDFVYVLDGFPQRDFSLWVFMYPINISPFRLYSASILCLYPGYHAEGYHAPSIPHGLSRLYRHCTATTPVYIFPGYYAIVLSSIPGLSHLSYHAPPHTYIGLSHPP